jgi:hypothetical protein
MTTGMFLIVLSAATVSQVASASTTGCQAYSSPQPFHRCTPVYFQGSIYYYDCCHECDTKDYSYNTNPDYDCTNCRDETGDGIPDVCDCCTAQAAPQCTNGTCENQGSLCKSPQYEATNGYCEAHWGSDCRVHSGCPCTCDANLLAPCGCQ